MTTEHQPDLLVLTHPLAGLTINGVLATPSTIASALNTIKAVRDYESAEVVVIEALLNAAQTVAAAATVIDDEDGAAVADNTDPVVAAEHELCTAWGTWSRTTRLYGPPPLAPGVLGKLMKKPAAIESRRDVECRPDLWALHNAITAQPLNTDRKVFELHYRYRVRNIKAAAAELGIKRPHWYRLLAAFRQRVCIGSRQIMADNQRQADALPHRSQVAP